MGRVKAIFNLFFFENESPIKIEKKKPTFYAQIKFESSFIMIEESESSTFNNNKSNYLVGGLVIKTWDQEIYSFYGFKFDSCSC